MELPLRGLFESPTIAELAHAVDAALQSETSGTLTPIERVDREGNLPLSFAQQRLWFIDKLSSGKAIQISVKINEAGLQFTPQQLFQSQTIAELAAILNPSHAQAVTTPEIAETGSPENGSAASDLPLAGFSQQELEKIAMLLEETDQLSESVE